MPQQIELDRIEWREDPLESDAESIGDMVGLSGFFSGEENRIAIELVRERLLQGISSGYRFLFAEKQGCVVGYACFGPIPGTLESYDLYWIVVRSDFRGFGLGKAILKKVEQKIHGLRGKRIYVETSSRDLYKPTRAFYRKCRYRQEAVLKDFYSPGDDKIIYVKAI